MSRTCLACLLLLTTVCTCEGGGTVVRTWRRLSVDSHVYTMQTYSRLVTAQSRIMCADLCSQTSACHVFYFRSDTGHCFLSPTLAKGNSKTSTPLNHVYFDGVTCPLNSTFLQLGFISCIKPSTTRVNLPTARQVCVDDGASFVSMKTKEKMELLINLVYKTTGIPDIWLNASLRTSDNRWLWSDGDILDLTHPLWLPTKPQGGGKYCLIAVYNAATNSYLYADVFCDVRTITCSFNSTYLVYSFTSCMKPYTTRVNLAIARQTCAADGASFLTMKTVEKMEWLIDLRLFSFLNKGILDMWMNASLRASDNRWLWSDGETLDLTHPLWLPGRPLETLFSKSELHDSLLER
ncbi:hypothetical protein C0Q70_14799 [Pomacea canaliculata]|uniref:C-type lectin domain-containing protein n=1 Tax=Pomacea canaliculata TaxID=400727 RepID=A0A2T7NT13_POMCA|nr:hypothetical protein C0Q70_14799 [Pomacea canaliculata]